MHDKFKIQVVFVRKHKARMRKWEVEVQCARKKVSIRLDE